MQYPEFIEGRLRYRLWIVLLLLALVLTWGAGVAQAEDGPVVRIVYFTAAECSHCHTVIDEVLTPLQAEYGDQVLIKVVEISDPANCEVLIRAEEMFDVSPEERGLPTLVIGGQVLIGEDSIRERLPCLLDTCLGAGGTSWPDIPGLEETAVEGEGWPGIGFDPEAGELEPCGPEEAEVCEGPAPIWVAYFYEVGCQECSCAEYDIRYVKSRHPQLLVEEYSVQDDAALAEWLGARFGVPEEQRLATPALFVGEDYLIGADITPEAVLALAEKYAPVGAERVWGGFDPEEAERSVIADEDEPVVHAVLFYSPNCPHCRHVVEEVLPPLMEQYREQLQIGSADTYTPEGGALYQAAVEYFQIPPERQGVPTLIIGDVVLVGSREIPERLPGLVAQGLAAGGVDWPAVRGLPAPTPITVSKLVARDMPGNAIAIGVLCGMVLSVGYVAVDGVRIWRKRKNLRGRKSPGAGPTRTPAWRDWALLALCLLGLVVASYLAYVETTSAEAVCGPVGDCNAVQQSEYAWLFGLIPIAVLGVMGYVCILVVWAWGRLGRGRLAELSPVALLGLSLLGTLFSIYLTFLEPFVVGATCAWCLVSAVSMTLLLLLVARSGWKVLRRVWLSLPAKVA